MSTLSLTADTLISGPQLSGTPDTLASAKARHCFTISGFDSSCDEVLAQRLYDLGFREGSTVECLRRAPLGSPIMFRVCDTDICLRASQAKLILADQNTQNS